MPKKTLIFHDTFLMKGGAERMNIEIAKILNADIATAVWHTDCYNPREMGFRGKVFEMHPTFRRGMFGFVRMKLAFIFAKYASYREKVFYCKNMQYKSPEKNRDISAQNAHFSLDDYDTILFSNEAISAIWSVPKHIRTLYYAHSISRHLFDQKDQYKAKIPLIFRPFFSLLSVFLRWIYRKEIHKIHTILTNSPANVRRIGEWLGRNDATFLPPPVDTAHFSPDAKKHITDTGLLPKEYMISFSRLTHAKAIDTIIQAFQRVSTKNIVIFYGNADSQKEEFFALAGITSSTEKHPCTGWYAMQSPLFPHIYFAHLSDNSLLPAYIANAVASVSISKNEDFGMVAIESLACGTPVIAVNEWGYQETILPEKTGWLLSPDNRADALEQWLLSDAYTKVSSMRSECVKASTSFSLWEFQKKLQEIL